MLATHVRKATTGRGYPQPQKPRERQPIANLIFRLLVRKIVQRLQNQHPEHHDRIDRLPASAALPHFVRRQYDRLNIGAKALPRHQAINRFERIAFQRQRRQPLFCIEEPELAHPNLPNHALTLETRTIRSGRVFFEAPLIKNPAQSALSIIRRNINAPLLYFRSFHWPLLSRTLRQATCNFSRCSWRHAR